MNAQINPVALFAILIFIGCFILTQSANANEDAYWENRAEQENSPEHEIVDNQPSPWAWIIVILIVVAVVASSVPKAFPA